jgi:hypothetical protein
MSSKRETPEQISQDEIAQQVKAFLAKGGKIYRAKIGESAIKLNEAIPLGMKSHRKERDTKAPKKGYLIPDKL